MQKPEKKTNTDGNRAKVCERVETNKTPPTHTHATLPNLDDPLKPLPPSIPAKTIHADLIFPFSLAP